jgi:hypothetical protein
MRRSQAGTSEPARPRARDGPEARPRDGAEVPRDGAEVLRDGAEVPPRDAPELPPEFPPEAPLAWAAFSPIITGAT